MRPFFSFLLGSQAAGLLGLTMALLVSIQLVSQSTPRMTQFDTAHELNDFAISRGLVFHCGNATGIAGGNFFLADHPVNLDDLAAVCTRRDCGLTPAWRGILWVSAINHNSDKSTLFPEQIGGKWRVWGNVLAAGDEDLMDRIEQLYRNP